MLLMCNSKVTGHPAFYRAGLAFSRSITSPSVGGHCLPETLEKLRGKGSKEANKGPGAPLA